MAAGTKSFTTQFLIGAKFVGQKGFDQANRQLTRTQKTAQVVSRGIGATAIGFGKLAGAIGVATVAYKALGKAVDFWQEGMRASEDAVKVQEALGVAAQRNAKRYKMSGAAIVKSINAVSEKVAKVGFDSEDAAAGTTKLLESMSPKEIDAFSQSYADLTAKLKGATPGMEGFEDVSTQVNTAILKGKAPWAAQLGASDTWLKALKEMEPAQRQVALRQLIETRLQGEAARVFDTTAGAVAKAAKAREDLGQTLTGPVVARQRELAEAEERLYKALEPVAELLASKMVPALENFSKWTADNQDKITAWGKAIVEWAGWAWDSFWWLQQKSENFFKPIADNTIREWNNITAGAQLAWDGMVAIWDKASGYFTSIVEAIGKAFVPLYNLIIKPFVDAYNYVSGLFPGTTPAKETEPYSGGARQESDYVPEWQQTGPPTAPAAPGGPQGGSGQYYSQVAAASTAGSVAALKGERARIAEELAQNPKLKQLLMASVKAEVGDQPAATQQAYMESIMNRAAAEKKSLQAIITNPNYYPAATKNKLGRTFSPPEQARMEAMTSEVLGGSNVANFATGNESGSVRSGGAPILSQPKGGYERFVGENWTKGWISNMRAASATKIPEKAAGPSSASTEATMQDAMMRSPGGAGGSLKHMIKEMNLQQRTSGATGGQNIAMNAPITVNGVAPGREALMAKKTALAMRDPTAQLLTEIKRARTQEQRLGYV